MEFSKRTHYQTNQSRCSSWKWL